MKRLTVNLPAPPSQWGIAELFIVSQTAIPALLFLPGTQGIRFYVRVASFAISMALLAWWGFGNAKHSKVHPAQTWLLVTIIYIAAMVLHPFTSSTLAGIAQLVLYVSVMAPLFWAPAVVRGPDHLARLMTLLLICNGVNACVGVLQVYDPGRWMPHEMSRLVTESEYGLGAVTYQGPNGLIVRPPGLFDNPGAVAGPGMYAALLGLVFVTSASPLWQRALALLGSFAGVAAIYLSQVRVSLVVLAIMLATYAGLLMFQQRKQRAVVFGAVAATLVVVTFSFAIGLGDRAGRQADGQRHAERHGDDPARRLDPEARDRGREEPAGAHAEAHARRAAGERERAGLGEEEEQDLAPARADRLHEADSAVRSWTETQRIVEIPMAPTTTEIPAMTRTPVVITGAASRRSRSMSAFDETVKSTLPAWRSRRMRSMSAFASSMRPWLTT